MATKQKVCCVVNCPAQSTPGLSYFTLPANIETRKLWLQAIRRPDLNHGRLNPNKYYVCSTHFDKTQIGILKEAPSEAPTKLVPAIRKGVSIIRSTTATQTDFQSDDDSDNDGEFVDCGKRKLNFDDEKVTIYKRAKPNRNMFVFCEIDFNDDIEVNNDDVTDEPSNTLRCSDNEPKDSIDLGNRKIFVFEEDENAVERRNANLTTNGNNAGTYLQIIPNSMYTVPLSFVGVPEFGQPSKQLLTHTVPISTFGVPSQPMLVMPIVPLPQFIVPRVLERVTPISTVQSIPGNSDAVASSNIVINDVVSLSKPNAKATLDKFLEWKNRTMGRRKGSKYDKDYKIFGLHLHTINTRAYRLLIDVWQLPKEEDLKDVQLNIGPRFNERVMKLLSQKLKLLSKEAKYCTLGLYTMDLKPHFYYDTANDEIVGVQNVDGVKTQTAARHALVAMVRGIKVPWHLPVAFSLFSTMEDLDNIEAFVTSAIVMLKRMGINIMGIVMSDDPCFWNYCKKNHFISASKFYLSIDKDKFVAVFDIPHVLNIFKDDFIKNDLVYLNKTVSWKYVQQLYDLDKDKENRLLPKLSDKHMKAESEEKSLKYPCQVFSRTVSAALHFYIDHGLIDQEAAQTAEFIKKINEVFDVLNITKLSKELTRNRKSVLQARAAAQLKAIDNAYGMFKRLKVQNDDNTIELESLEYFSISFKSLSFIAYALKNANQIGIIQTRLSYLEPMQEFLKAIEKNAKTNIPSSIQFTRAFSKLFVKYLVDLNPPPTSIGNMDDFFNLADDMKPCYEVNDEPRICLKDTDYRFALPEKYAIIYVSSYLTYKCYQKHKCPKLEESMERLVDMNKTKIYEHFEKYNKESVFYDHLKLPIMSFVFYIERLDDCFIETFNNNFHTNPADSILGALKSVPKWDFPCSCYPQDYLLKLFVRTRIYQTVFHNTRCLKKVSFDNPYSLVVKKL